MRIEKCYHNHFTQSRCWYQAKTWCTCRPVMQTAKCNHRNQLLSQSLHSNHSLYAKNCWNWSILQPSFWRLLDTLKIQNDTKPSLAIHNNFLYHSLKNFWSRKNHPKFALEPLLLCVEILKNTKIVFLTIKTKTLTIAFLYSEWSKFTEECHESV